MPETPTQTIPPAAAPPSPPGLLTATHTPASAAEPIHQTRPFDGAGSPTAFPTPDDRYTVQRFLARGGMGEVWVAHDRVLNRDVAVKILRDDLKDREFVASRFIEEARITGKLEHPGIVPIHDLGSFRDGRPFIAMKLLKDGRTLSELLAANRPDLSELLRIFDDVCQAVASAHERRVIHRDLKPGNVMVGRFNEVQVMDWGLAKVLGDLPAPATHPAENPGNMPTRSPISVIESDRDPSSHTRAGSLLGTPAYMPPEQAKGEIDRTDTRSDVFALGAMLCELLTGKPPYWAATTAEIQAYALTAQLGPAQERLDACGADPELIALARHCLQPDPDKRPADAKHVANAIAFYRDGVEARLRKAERERAAAEARTAEEVNTRREAEARAEEHRKRRRVQLALVVVAALIALGTGGAAWWLDRQAEERERTNRENRVERDRLEAERSADARRQQAEQVGRRQRNGEAIEALLGQVEAALRAEAAEKAEVPFVQIDRRLPEGGGEHLAVRIARARADLAMLKALEAVDDTVWGTDERRGQSSNRAFTAAFRQYGLDLETTDPAAAVQRIDESTIRERLLLALDLWHLYYPRSRRPAALRKWLDLLDPDKYRIEVRDAMVRNDAALSRELLDDPQAGRQPARFAAVIGQIWYFPTSGRERVLRPAIDRTPNDFYLLLSMLLVHEISTEYRAATVAEQFRWAQAAVAVRPASKLAWRHLGRAHWDKGQMAEAIRCYKRAVRLDPSDAASFVHLSAGLLRYHDPEAALVAAERAIQLAPEYAAAHNILGSVLQRMGRHPRALEAFETAIAIDRNNGIETADYINNRGFARLHQGNLNGAIADFQDALRLNPNFRIAETNLNHARELRKGGRERIAAPPPRPVPRPAGINPAARE